MSYLTRVSLFRAVAGHAGPSVNVASLSSLSAGAVHAKDRPRDLGWGALGPMVTVTLEADTNHTGSQSCLCNGVPIKPLNTKSGGASLVGTALCASSYISARRVSPPGSMGRGQQSSCLETPQARRYVALPLSDLNLHPFPVTTSTTHTAASREVCESF